ncbi:MAG TPA: hypothetical protein VGD55_06705 [Acidothermaceae bacterium]
MHQGRQSHPLTLARRVAGAALVSVAITACATNRSHTATDAPSQAPVPSAPSFRSPTPTEPPTPALGSLTTPLPAGITTVKVTFLRGTRPVYEVSITDRATVQQIIGDVDDSHQDTGQTQGCAMRPVTMTLEFIAPSTDAVYSEDSGCARASLAIGGSQGPLLDAALTDGIEQLLHVTFDLNGSPSVAPAS